MMGLIRDIFQIPNLIFLAGFFVIPSLEGQKKYKYSLAPKDTTVDNYFGQVVEDPYRWMENSKDHRLVEWLSEQEKFTKKQTRRGNRNNLAIRRQLTTMYSNVEESLLEGAVNVNVKLDKYEFHYKYGKYDRHPDLQYRLWHEKKYKTLVEVKDFQADKEDQVSITNYYVNEEYNIAAIEICHNGSDWREIYFYDLKSGEQLADTLINLRSTDQITWDGQSLYYVGYDQPKSQQDYNERAKGQRLYYHELGTAQSQDRMLYRNPDTSGFQSFDYVRFDEGLFFYQSYRYQDRQVNTVSIANMGPNYFYFQNCFVYPDSDSISVSVEAVFEDRMILKTNWNAPNGRVLLANIDQEVKPIEIVPEYDIPLRNVERLGKDKIACLYRNNGQYLALVYSLSGELLANIHFPVGKKVNYFYEYDKDAKFTNFSLSSFYHPELWYQLSLDDFSFKAISSVTVPYDPDQVETRYVKYQSADGTMIPMYITCLKTTELNGKNPALMYVYGGYGITVEPIFDELKALWILHGGILAVPNIRGGGAEGSQWSNSGRRLKKTNAIDDVTGGAEYLIEKNYTDPDNLAIEGGSHGGLMVGAAITKRPELFKVAIAEAGPMDMLALDKSSAGSVEVNILEFGSTSDSQDFQNLFSYSPLHNIHRGIRYPNTLLISGDSDERVPPFHSFKFLASLQEKGDPRSLYHLYLIPGSGHQVGLTPEAWAEKILYKAYFLFDQFDIKFY